MSYNIDADGVEPIFYPVVPDSFMYRDQEGVTPPPFHPLRAEWSEPINRPLLAPRDQWSF
jgi:hypothetical protein